MKLLVYLCCLYYLVTGFTYLGKWPISNGELRLTWFITNYSSTFSKLKTKIYVEKAFDIWQTQQLTIKFNFSEARRLENANITIAWLQGNHGDKSPFDDGGNETRNILAHAFYPPSGQIHFDNFENWTEDNLPYVLVHEIGHSLGLGHSKRKEAIMYPEDKAIPFQKINLDIDDKCGIDWIYNSPSQYCLFVRMLTEY
jgi:hypothetical protein